MSKQSQKVEKNSFQVEQKGLKKDENLSSPKKEEIKENIIIPKISNEELIKGENISLSKPEGNVLGYDNLFMCRYGACSYYR